MKNFRKVLALVLVVATLFSFAAMASAAQYEDADKISYDMAVDVLSAVGILNGYEVKEGVYEFHPTATITREEMAKMIGVMANAGYDVSKLYADAVPFADVSKDRYSASYITYCAKTGIVAGRSATTFDPMGKVTGLETAKMLLVVLGFDAEHQGYVGADWKVNVLRDAKLMGLLNGFAANYNVDTAITREEAANMMLNALLAPCVVGFISNNHVTITNALTFKDATVNKVPTFKVTNYATLMDALKNGEWALYGNVVISDSPLYTTLFKGLEFITSTDADCFGRSMYGFKYVVNGVVKASGSYGMGNAKLYTTNVDLRAEYKNELSEKNGNYDVTVMANGVEIGGSKDQKIKYVSDWTGNGTETYVTVDGAKKVVRVSFVNTFVGKVSKISNYAKTFSIVDEKGNTVFSNVAMKDAVKEGDVVAFQICNHDRHANIYGAQGSDKAMQGQGVHAYTVVTPVQATVDYTRHYNNDVKTGSHNDSCYLETADGKTYKYNNRANELYKAALNHQNDVNQGDVKNIYLDKYGYIILIDDVKTATKVAVFDEKSLTKLVTETVWEGGKWVEKTAAGMKVAPFTGNTVATVELADEKTLDKSALFNHYIQMKDTYGTAALIAYTVDANGFASITTGCGFVTANTVITNKAGDVAVSFTNKTNLTLTADTNFIIRSTDPKTGAWTYEEVMGVQNLKEAYAVVSTKNGGTTAQALDLNKDNFADYVFIDAKYTSTATEFMVMGETSEYTASWTGVAGVVDKGQYNAYRALVNGKDALVLFAKDANVKLDRGTLYTSALQLKGVAMVKDGDLPLYVATTAAIKNDVNGKEAVPATLNIQLDSANNVYVKFDGVDGKHHSAAAVAELPVYHVMDDQANNDYLGYWVETNNFTLDVAHMGTIQHVFVVFNADGVATAVYAMHNAAPKN